MARLVLAVAPVVCGRPAHGQLEPTVRAVTGEIAGHHVGGVSVDAVGNVYVADFDDTVWKITPEGVRTVFATGFYGASGNAIDGDGRLLQASFHDDRIVRLDRSGRSEPFTVEGLDGPVGIALGPGAGYTVANCRANSLSRLDEAGRVVGEVESALFRCPNGVTATEDGVIYVANFSDGRVLRVSERGDVTVYAELPSAGLGHLCFLGAGLYVTAFRSHQVYRIDAPGRHVLLAGTGRQGSTSGPARSAELSFPNGIACERYRSRLYVNEFLGPDIRSTPRRTMVRLIDLGW